MVAHANLKIINKKKADLLGIIGPHKYVGRVRLQSPTRESKTCNYKSYALYLYLVSSEILSLKNTHKTLPDIGKIDNYTGYDRSNDLA